MPEHQIKVGVNKPRGAPKSGKLPSNADLLLKRDLNLLSRGNKSRFTAQDAKDISSETSGLLAFFVVRGHLERMKWCCSGECLFKLQISEIGTTRQGLKSDD
jgi:hypothetical protein